VIAALAATGIDLIDISGGTYFPGAPSTSDRAGSGPYFLEFAGRARAVTRKPLMVTGGFKTLQQAESSIAEEKADVVGLARALVLNPGLPNEWLSNPENDLQFPRFDDPPEGGITAWYTMQITRIANGDSPLAAADLRDAIRDYEDRDLDRCKKWNERF